MRITILKNIDKKLENMTKYDKIILVKDMSEVKNKNKTIYIFGISIWRILAYFIIYSILGFFIETIYGFLTKGVIESRQGFLYGPFCPIYGVGAVVMIVTLQCFKKNIYTIFLGGFLVGSVVEYLVSFFGELIFNMNWWDYSDRFLNINGRICVTFSLFWGVLAIYLLKHFNPIVDKTIEKIKSKVSLYTLKTIVAIAFALLMLDFAMTGLALKVFFARTVNKYDLEVAEREKYVLEYNNLLQNEKLAKATNTLFSDKKMLKTFPNLKLKSNSGDIIYMNDILSHIQPYYFKFFDK